MDYQNILEMVKADIISLSENSEYSIDDVVDYYNHMSSSDTKEDKMEAIKLSYKMLSSKDIFRQIFKATDLLTLGNCLSQIGQTLTNELESKRFLEAAYGIYFAHFDSGNRLEKGFAAEHLMQILITESDKMNDIFFNIAFPLTEDPLYDSIFNSENNQIGYLSIVKCGLIPYLKKYYEMYPDYTNIHIDSYCDILLDELEPTNDDLKNFLEIAQTFGRKIEQNIML